jgi:hypothetical protein
MEAEDGQFRDGPMTRVNVCFVTFPVITTRELQMYQRQYEQVNVIGENR